MSSRSLFLGIDIGTTSVKATLIDEEFKSIGQRRVEYKTQQLKPLWIEQDPWDWWKATCVVIQEILEFTKVSSNQLKGIGVSSQAPTLLSIDETYQPIGQAMIWMDRRSYQECEEIMNSGAHYYIERVTGNRIDPYYMLPKLLWDKKNRPEKYQRTYKYIQANGWIVLQLTGQTSVDVSHAALTQLFNIQENKWDETIGQSFDLSLNKLPDIYECIDTVGSIKPEIAKEIGLTEGTPVIAGAIDGATAPLGLKMIENNQAFEMSGQSSGIGVVLNKPKPHPNLALLKHAINGKWILKGSMSASGGSLQWFRDHVDESIEDMSAYSKYEDLVRNVPPGSKGLIYLPYLAGERAPLWDHYAKGVFFGLHFQTGKAEMIRSIMEGTAFGLRAILEEIQSTDIQINELYGTGGGYLSQEWSQIKADILQEDIFVANSENESASLGAAYLALMSINNHRPTQIPTVNINEIFTPNEHNVSLFNDYYEIFKKLYYSNKHLFKKLESVGE